MAKIIITQTREADIDPEEYINVPDWNSEDGDLITITDLKQIVEWERESFERGHIHFEEYETVIDTKFELVEE